MSSNIEKNKQIAASMSATYQKRKKQVCKTYRLKVDKSALTKEQKEILEMKFIEAKRIYNYILGEKLNAFKIGYKDICDIYYLDKDHERIDYTIKHLKSSEIQGIIDVIRASITGLSMAKANGNKVGELQFKSEYNSLYYKQYGITYFIRGKKIHIQGIHNDIRVCGLKQLNAYNMDITCAHLIKDAGDYYIALTCFVNKEDIKKNNTYKKDIIGIDFGCTNTITLSDGTKMDIKVKETERLKKLQAKLSRQVKHSNGYNETKRKIQKEYNHINNIKNDISNKIVHQLLSDYAVIVTQNDNISEWKTTEGKCESIQHSILGRVKDRLKQSNQVVMLEQWFPTSKQCTVCGHKHSKLTESDRTFVCPVCGYTEDRDVHAAKNMIYYYNKVKDTLGTSEASKLVAYTTYKNLVAQQEDAGL